MKPEPSPAAFWSVPNCGFGKVPWETIRIVAAATRSRPLGPSGVGCGSGVAAGVAGVGTARGESVTAAVAVVGAGVATFVATGVATAGVMSVGAGVAGDGLASPVVAGAAPQAATSVQTPSPTRRAGHRGKRAAPTAVPMPHPPTHTRAPSQFAPPPTPASNPSAIPRPGGPYRCVGAIGTGLPEVLTAWRGQQARKPAKALRRDRVRDARSSAWIRGLQKARRQPGSPVGSAEGSGDARERTRLAARRRAPGKRAS